MSEDIQYKNKQTGEVVPRWWLIEHFDEYLDNSYAIEMTMDGYPVLKFTVSSTLFAMDYPAYTEELNFWLDEGGWEEV